MWYPSIWEEQPMASLFSAFNFLFGPDPENFVEIGNSLKDVLMKFWSYNRYFPSNVRIIADKNKKGNIRR